MRLPPLRLAGADWRDRLLAAAGALIGTALSGLVSGWIVGSEAALLLVAPIGASAVLLFAVPSSPLGQPWSVIGGSIVSTLASIAAAQWLGHGALAAGAAVALAMVAMSALRCLHPAGGGCALLAVLGGPAILEQGYGFAFVPVGLNAVMLVVVGVIFHRFSHHSYPHRAMAAPPRPRLLPEDIDAALTESGESFDIAVEDLQALLERAERHAELRRG